jgi:hypothetical protein
VVEGKRENVVLKRSRCFEVGERRSGGGSGGRERDGLDKVTRTSERIIWMDSTRVIWIGDWKTWIIASWAGEEF